MPLYIYIFIYKKLYINTDLEASAKDIMKNMYFKAFEELKLPEWKTASYSS